MLTKLYSISTSGLFTLLLSTTGRFDKRILSALPYFKERHEKAISGGEIDFLDKLHYRLTSPLLRGKITELKQLAQHPEIDQQALAQYAIAGHIFEVKDKGSSVFPFVIEDGAFRISLSRASKFRY